MRWPILEAMGSGEEEEVVGGGTTSYEDVGGGLARARAMLQALAPRSRTWSKRRLMSLRGVSAFDGHISLNGISSYQQSLTQTSSYFIAKVVDASRLVCVARRALSLQPFVVPVEDL